MGSPVSAVIANLVMKHVEQKALATAPVSLRFGSDLWIISYLWFLEKNWYCTAAFKLY